MTCHNICGIINTKLGEQDTILVAAVSFVVRLHKVST